MIRRFIIICIILCIPQVLKAQENLAIHTETNFTAAEFGRASSGLAAVDAVSSLFDNPATLAATKGYAAEAGYLHQKSSFMAALTDNSSGSFAGGVGYIQVPYTNEVMFRRVPISASKDVLPHLNLGATVTYVRLGSESQWFTDVGLWSPLTGAITIGLLGKNLIKWDPRFGGRILKAGLGFQPPLPVYGTAEISRDFDLSEYMGWAFGLSGQLMDVMLLSGGVRQSMYLDVRNERPVLGSLGIGYQSAQMRLTLSMEQPLNQANPQRMIMAFLSYQTE